MASFQKREKNGKPSYTAKIRIKGHKPVFNTFDRLKSPILVKQTD